MRQRRKARIAAGVVAGVVMLAVPSTAGAWPGDAPALEFPTRVAFEAACVDAGGEVDRYDVDTLACRGRRGWWWFSVLDVKFWWSGPGAYEHRSGGGSW